MYGHIAALARSVKKGVDSIEGMEGVLYQVRPLPCNCAPNACNLWAVPAQLICPAGGATWCSNCIVAGRGSLSDEEHYLVTGF